MNNFSFYILCVIGFIVSPVSLSSQINKNVNDEVKTLIFNLESAKVDSALQKINHTPSGVYLNLYQAFVSCIISNNIDFNEYCTNYNSQIDFLKRESKTKPYVLHVLSELYLQRGILEYQNENAFTAVNCFSKAYSYWKDSEHRNPDSNYNLKLSGIFNLLVSKLPKPYSTMGSWFGYSGNTEKGFEDLKAYLSNSNKGYGDYFEALLYLGFSYLKFEKNESVIEKFIIEHSSLTLPEFLQAIMVRCANKIHHPDLCSEILNKPSVLPMLDYLKGKYNVQKGSDMALLNFHSFLSKEKSMQFKADAFRYLSWYYLLEGDKAQYLNCQDSIKVLSCYPTSEDKQAKYENELPLLPDPVLLEARLLFDCGKFKEAAIGLVNNKKNLAAKSDVEFHYRLGRCYYYLDHIGEALSQYQIAIDFAGEDQRYFGPYAALYAARICLDVNDPAGCEYYLNKASELNNGEYKNSINQEIDCLYKVCSDSQ